VVRLVARGKVDVRQLEQFKAAVVPKKSLFFISIPRRRFMEKPSNRTIFIV
jgi:hypothetical protein